MLTLHKEFNLIQKITSELKNDPRYFQIIYHSLFLCFGLYVIGWNQQWLDYAVIMGTAVFTQAIFVSITHKNFSSIKSAMITGLGICLLLKGNSLIILSFATFLAIGSKFIIRFKGTHFFNPANFGIIVSILITDQTWISPGQWGQNVILVYFLLAAGIMMLTKVNRMDTILSFLITFMILEYCRTCLYLGWSFDVFTHKILNGSFLLFAFFMITDPVTTPRSNKARIIWASLVAVLTFILSNWFYVHTAPMWALFFVAPLTVIFNKYMQGNQFMWNQKNKINQAL